MPDQFLDGYDAGYQEGYRDKYGDNPPDRPGLPWSDGYYEGRFDCWLEEAANCYNQGGIAGLRGEPSIPPDDIAYPIAWRWGYVVGVISRDDDNSDICQAIRSVAADLGCLEDMTGERSQV